MFPTEEIFDFDTWTQNDFYMKIVKEEENLDLVGNKKLYSMHHKFQLCVLALYDSDEQILKLCKKVPMSDEFVRIIVDK